jgi:asparagine synthase (glutamine-hydrolysing)
MRYGLEVRSPFLSRPLIEFANTLPVCFKKRGGELKWLLRESLHQRGYPANICRQKKRGFTFPVARWMTTTFRSRLEAAVSSGRRIQDVVDGRVAREFLMQHMEGRCNHYRILFNILILSEWLERHPEVAIV